MTHAFTGRSMRVIGQDGEPLPAVLDARQRGIRFDVGHGAGSFDVAVAQRLVEAGFLPDSVSSDLHQLSLPSVGGMSVVLSKMLALGVPLAAVIRMATTGAAATFPELASRSTLEPGAPADLAVFRLKEGTTQHVDSQGEPFVGETALEHSATYRSGVLCARDGMLVTG